MTVRVLSLHRFPVKSMTGEALPQLDIDERGCVGDRLWSVRTGDGRIGSGKTTRRFAAVRGLLELHARHRDGQVEVRFPDGRTCRLDDADAAARLSRQLRVDVTVARESAVSHFDDGPISLVGMASVAALAAERGVEIEADRFRANLVLDTSVPFVEEEWIGQVLTVGSAVLRVDLPSPRCVMVDMATADLPAQAGNLRALGGLNGARLGVIASVLTPGTVTIGDEVTLG